MELNPRGWAIACDIDDTLVPTSRHTAEQQATGSVALDELCAVIEYARAELDAPIRFGSVTGRTIVSHEERESQVPAFAAAASVMDFKVTSVGAESHIRTPQGFARVSDWPQTSAWQRDKIYEALIEYPGLTLQPADAQGDYKVSFDVIGQSDDSHDGYVAKIAAELASSGLAGHVVFSAGIFLDILPEGVDKGSGLLHTMRKLFKQRPTLIAAGDSMNDRDLLRVADMAIVPANAHDSLKQWAERVIPPQNLYMAKRPFASGVLEGVKEAFDVFS